MDVTFLIGPAGSGKTRTCLDQIRLELKTRPEGPPLVFLAPKQATFQIEKQLLEDPDLHGFTRLQVLSFERLAQFILDESCQSVPRVLSEEGRLMVLRSLLISHQTELKVFRQIHQSTGLAQEMDQLIREFQRQHITPESLVKCKAYRSGSGVLNGKLQDIKLIYDAYRNWLKRECIEDPNHLLDLASQALRDPKNRFQLAALWLDGFAEMATQEVELLSTIIRCTDQSTLAFCLDNLPRTNPSWITIWNVVGETYSKCWNRISAIHGCRTRIISLASDQTPWRFVDAPPLAHLERHWSKPIPFNEPPDVRTGDFLRLVSCPNPELELIHAARQIRAAVRDTSLRYRDISVSLRSLKPYGDLIPGVFDRYEIPYFLDGRESITHHPLVEMTRHMLRLACYGWRNQDWFPILKTGLLPVADKELDFLENKALEHGWDQGDWTRPFRNPSLNPGIIQAESTRLRITPPFLAFLDSTRSEHKPSESVRGSLLTEAIRNVWKSLKVEDQIHEWTVSEGVDRSQGIPAPATHHTAWEEINRWIENIDLAFGGSSMAWPDWLPILESGLDTLTVGVIPARMDQVMIGTIDRSRQPKIRMSLILGFNESVFPKAERDQGLLSDLERNELQSENLFLTPDRLRKLGHERFYGYIALTRACSRVVVSWSQADSDGVPMNPSPMLRTLEALFPGLPTEDFQIRDMEPEHPSESLFYRMRIPAGMGVDPIPADLSGDEDRMNTRFDPELSDLLYGSNLSFAVSRLEHFAACPFRFAVLSGLKAEERRIQELQYRERGQLIHRILDLFHKNLKSEGGTWHDLDPARVEVLLERTVREVEEEFMDGFLKQSKRAMRELRDVRESIRLFLMAMSAWMHQYAFEPSFSELSFGLDESGPQAVKLVCHQNTSLSIRGIIDRVDLWRDPESGEAYSVILDYKSGGRGWDNTLVHHGVHIQLPVYAHCLKALSASGELGLDSVVEPAGLFYVGLRPTIGNESNRNQALELNKDGNPKRFRHLGCYRSDLHDQFDNRNEVRQGDQFPYTKSQTGFRKSSQGPMEPSVFQQTLDHCLELLESQALAIRAGHAEIHPCRHGSYTACDSCLLKEICRFDPVQHPYKLLAKAEYPGQLKQD